MKGREIGNGRGRPGQLSSKLMYQQNGKRMGMFQINNINGCVSSRIYTHSDDNTRNCDVSSLTRVKGLHDVLTGDQANRRYDLLLLDQFGVLHDGRKAYSCSQDAVIKAQNMFSIPSVIISNSSRRVETTFDSLRTKGFDCNLFEGCITSGEVTYQSLVLPRHNDFFSKLGPRCVHVTWKDRNPINVDNPTIDSASRGKTNSIDLETKSTGVEAVGLSYEIADFVLMHGVEAIGKTKLQKNGTFSEDLETIDIESLLALLNKCAERHLPLIVANPDVCTVDGNQNQLQLMPGWFARQYDNMGGKFVLMGKPNSVIFDAALSIHNQANEAAQNIVDRRRVLVVGDSLAHDIAGGSRAGFDTLFITKGIHYHEIYEGNNVEDSAKDGKWKTSQGVRDRILHLCKEIDVPLPTYYAETLGLAW